MKFSFLVKLVKSRLWFNNVSENCINISMEEYIGVERRVELKFRLGTFWNTLLLCCYGRACRIPRGRTYVLTQLPKKGHRSLAYPQESKYRLGIMVASHNEDTVRYAIQLMKERGIRPEDKVVCFGQLLGMCDHITFPLGEDSIQQLGVVAEALTVLLRKGPVVYRIPVYRNKLRITAWKFNSNATCC